MEEEEKELQEILKILEGNEWRIIDELVEKEGTKNEERRERERAKKSRGQEQEDDEERKRQHNKKKKQQRQLEKKEESVKQKEEGDRSGEVKQEKGTIQQEQVQQEQREETDGGESEQGKEEEAYNVETIKVEQENGYDYIISGEETEREREEEEVWKEIKNSGEEEERDWEMEEEMDRDKEEIMDWTMDWTVEEGNQEIEKEKEGEGRERRIEEEAEKTIILEVEIEDTEGEEDERGKRDSGGKEKGAKREWKEKRGNKNKNKEEGDSGSSNKEEGDNIIIISDEEVEEKKGGEKEVWAEREEWAEKEEEEEGAEESEERERKKNERRESWENNNKEIEEVEGGFENLMERDIDIPKGVRIILSLGEKFIIPYKDTEIGQIVQMIRDGEKVWQECRWEDRARNFGKWKNEIIKIAIKNKKAASKGEEKIMEMIQELEEFMIKNKDVTVEQTDKGKKTIIMEKERKDRMERLFMEEAQNRGMYRMEKMADKKGEKIMGNREMAKLRRKISDWKERGIFKERSERNIGKEKEMWDTMINVGTEVPEMRFIIKAHKEEIGIRNLCPKNKTWTYGISRVVDNIIRKGLKENLQKMGYIDRNIRDVVKWGQEIEGMKIEEEEEMVTVDVKEMFNMIDTDKLISMVRRNINWREYNEEVVTEMMEYDLKEANYVEHKGRIYKQMKGIPMGAPSSCAYADTFLNIHIMLYEGRMEKCGIRNMSKYIDDIFFIAKKGKWEKILKEMEKDTGMEMKSEKEEEKGEVEFLDIKLSRKEGEIEIERNKKKYMSKRHIHRMSNHNDKQKRETLISTVQRTINLTSKGKLREKIERDMREFKMNGYDKRYIEGILEDVIRRGENRKRKWGWKGMMGETGNKNIREEEKMRIIKECWEEIRKERNSREMGRGITTTTQARNTQKRSTQMEDEQDKQDNARRGEVQKDNKKKEEIQETRKTTTERIEEGLKKTEKKRIKRGKMGGVNKKYIRIPYIRTPYRADTEEKYANKIRELTKTRIGRIGMIRRGKRLDKIIKKMNGRDDGEGSKTQIREEKL